MDLGSGDGRIVSIGKIFGLLYFAQVSNAF